MDASSDVLSSGSPLGPGDPTVLDGYTMLRRLGEGGMGTVYLARGPGDRLVAVKVIRPEFAQIDEFRVRFRQETDHARRVARFCTAEVLDADPDGDKPYLVTEFVDGSTLARVVSSTGPLSAANFERLAVGIAAALSAIHGAGIVHRDLKPANVMLSPYGPRVIDFGIARAADAALGLTEVRIGTPAFMAPEQILGDPLTGAVDIFAWGAVVAYASSGKYPFGSSSEAQFYKIVQNPPDLSGLEHDSFLRPIVERAMNKNPSARPSATELLLSLLSNTNASVPDNPEAAVTQALGGWSATSSPYTMPTAPPAWAIPPPQPAPPAQQPPESQPRTPAPAEQTAAPAEQTAAPAPQTAPPAEQWDPPTEVTAQPWSSGAPPSTGAPSSTDVGPQPPTGVATGVDPLAATGLAGTPTSPPAVPTQGVDSPPPSGPAGATTYPHRPAGGTVPQGPGGLGGPGGPAAPGRAPTGPPVRPLDAPPPTGAPGSDTTSTGGRKLVLVLIAVLIIAGGVFAGITLTGNSKSRHPSAATTTGATTTGATTTPSVAAVAFPIPQSAQPLSADTIAFTDSATKQLYTMRSDGTGLKQLGTVSDADLPAISPDRRSVAYFVSKDGVHSLWIMAADGTGARPTNEGASKVLVPNSGDRTAWSPDGKSIAFVAKVGNDGVVALYVVDVETGTFRRLPTPARIGQPSWSPNGDLIVYWSSASEPGGPLYTIAADGKSAPKEIDDNLDYEPVWSPDGQQITFQRVSGHDIWTMNANGADPRNLTGASVGTATDMNPSYSTTGIIVFSSNRSGASRLYTINPSQPDAVPMLIPGQTLSAVSPSWSQDPV